MSVLEQFSMKGKNLLVTGGARGIGCAVAKGFADAGANVCIADVNAKEAQATAKQIEKAYNVKTLALQCDVTNQAQVRDMVNDCIKKFSNIDVLLNNAGICINNDADKMTCEEWKKVMDININGVFYVAQEVGKYMIEQGGGSIINTASMAASMVVWPQPQVAYNASKAAVVMLTKSMAAEWAKHNVRVNCISPGYTRTDLTDAIRKDWRDYWNSVIPMGRMAETHELVGAVIYLASDAATYTTGTDIIIDGGTTCI